MAMRFGSFLPAAQRSGSFGLGEPERINTIEFLTRGTVMVGLDPTSSGQRAPTKSR